MRLHDASAALKALIGIAALLPVLAMAQDLSADPDLKPGAWPDPHRPLAQELVASAGPAMTVTLVGSLLLDSPSDQPPPFDVGVRALLNPGRQNATVGVLQGPLVDARAAGMYPYPWDAAPALRADPRTAAWLREQGFSGVMRATAHALDWGIEGMRATTAGLDEAKLPHAGTGDTLGVAAHADYIDDPAGGGRIAIVSAATTFRPTSNALAPHGAAPGRPGISGIDLDPTRLVAQKQVAELQTIACRFQYPNDASACAGLSPAATVTALGSTFSAESDPTRQGTTRYDINVTEANFVLSNIREGKENADYLVAAINAGEISNAKNPLEIPDFLQKLLQAAITAGADAAFATGRAELGGIQIYTGPNKRKFPIFYGLGNFAWSSGYGQPGTVQGVLVRLSYGDAQGTIDIFPLDLSTGWPVRARQAIADATLDRLNDLSRQFGTTIAKVNADGFLIGRITYSLFAQGGSR